MPSILEQAEESSQGSGWMLVQLKRKRRTRTMHIDHNVQPNINFTELQLLPSQFPRKTGGNPCYPTVALVLLTVPEVQTHRQLLPLAVAGLMPRARHVATGHEPRRLTRPAGGTQRRSRGGVRGGRQLGSLENGGSRGKNMENLWENRGSMGNHGFYHGLSVKDWRCPEKNEPNLGACELKTSQLNI